MSASWLGLTLVWAAVGCCACSPTEGQGRQAVVILGVDDRASGSPAGLQFDEESAKAHLHSALTASRTLYQVEQQQPGAFSAEMTIGLASERHSDVEGEAGTYRAVQVELQLHRRGDDGRERISATGSAFLVQGSDSDRQEGFDQVLRQAISRAVDNVDLQIETRSSSSLELRKKLASERAEDRLYVLRSLRDRKVPELVTDVIALLSDEDDDVVLEAVGVLVDQKDRRAVEPLIRMSQTRDPVFQLQLITAVAELGGEVARGYLFTLAAGHRSNEIRKRAGEGLDRIREQEAQEKTGQPADTALALPREARGDPEIHK